MRCALEKHLGAMPEPGERQQEPQSIPSLESVLGSLAPLPNKSIDLDDEIAEAIAEALGRKYAVQATDAE